MDRNAHRAVNIQRPTTVALRKESVDRNLIPPLSGSLCCVALRKESVDRNRPASHLSKFDTSSLSARRAWIEILTWHFISEDVSVALRKESVDRNVAVQSPA